MNLSYKNKYVALIVLSLVCFMASGQNKPNVIVIMADDLGYADVGFNGSTEIPTPNIDRIADNGIKFTSAYTTYSVCGPSRAGFITGRYQQRFGFERNPLYRVDDPHMGLPLDEMTIAESVAQVGYKSGIIGKWHLGAHISNHPLNRGFDEFYGHLGGGHRYFPEDLTIEDSYAATNEEESYLTWILRNHTPEKTDEYITDEFSNEAVEFVSRHKDHPFFLFLSYNAPHTPLQAKNEDLALYPLLTDNRKTYAAMVHAVDRGVGKVLDKLQELNIEGNTMVFFLSDNGGPESKNASDNGILRGGKSDVFEGGYRVPFAMQWTDEIDGGGTYDYPVSSLDIFATLSALSDAPVNPEKPLDGVNLIPYLKGENGSRPHETIHIRKFDQDRHAVRYGDMKYIRFKADSPNPRLYDLSTNISESDADGQNLYWNADFRSQRDELQAIQTEWEEGLLHPRFLGLVHDELLWANEVTLSSTTVELSLNDTYQLEAAILPADAFNNVIEWSSTNSSVASVDENGTVSAHHAGYTIITARVADRRQVYKHCVVKVGNPAPATSVSLSESRINLITGQTVSLVAAVSSSDNSTHTVQWSSNNPAVASVSEDGFVFTHSEGAAVVSASVVGAAGVTDHCSINVYPYGTVTSVSNADIAQDNLFTVYPNPVSGGRLAFVLHHKTSGIKAGLYNAMGCKVMEVSLNNAGGHAFDVSALKDGMYFLHVTVGSKQQTKKIMVNN